MDLALWRASPKCIKPADAKSGKQRRLALFKVAVRHYANRGMPVVGFDTDPWFSRFMKERGFTIYLAKKQGEAIQVYESREDVHGRVWFAPPGMTKEEVQECAEKYFQR